MAKIRTILKSTKDADGRHAVLLMLSDRKQREYFSTGFSATDKEFDSSKQGGRFHQGRGVRPFYLKRKEEDGSTKVYSNKDANIVLANLENRASDILKGYNEKHINWGLDQFRTDFVNAPKRELFSSFADSIIQQEYSDKGRHKSATVALEAIRSLERYDSQLGTKSFQDINVKYLTGYIAFCKKNGNSDSTIKIRLGEIRRIFNIAIREGVASQENYPFSSGKEDGKIRIPKTTLSKTDQYLPMDSMKKLANTPMENHVLERTRHLFLFSYYCRGMNWKDMALLTKSSFFPLVVTDENTKETREVTMMEYRRSKTKGEFLIQVTPNIQRELDWFSENTALYADYVLPIISVEITPEKMDMYIAKIRQRFNHSLRKIAEILEFPDSQQDISSYTARHSFAMTMQNLNKPVEIISQALGHQSVETTKHYLAKFSSTKMAKETDIDLSY